jgi:hypothetical protein
LNKLDQALGGKAPETIIRFLRRFLFADLPLWNLG